jgi:hypothetical protein
VYSRISERHQGDLGTAALIIADAPVTGWKSLIAATVYIENLRTVEPNPNLLTIEKESL